MNRSFAHSGLMPLGTSSEAANGHKPESHQLLIRGVFTLAALLGIAVLAGSGCKQTGVGDPCRPEVEYQASFNGFDRNTVYTESKSYQCQTRLCLVNHFQGRVTCPYGQTGPGVAAANAPPGEGACTIPGTAKDSGTSEVTGGSQPDLGQTVVPQCVDRQADEAVYCSCRCANADGKTDDGANYCSCPDGFSCDQLVPSLGAVSSQQLAGGYCVKANTRYDPLNACGATCDATNKCNSDN
ncbi:MAG TPA: hypothetical protein VNO21_25155 [Polyangiaceae bacterium]|nr:hypothetical protein [Polyangiaceae bacterium]